MISCKLRKFYNFGNGEQYHHDHYKMNDDIYVKLEIDFFLTFSTSKLQIIIIYKRFMC